MCISSYNSTGFSVAVQNYVETLLLFSDIIWIQEHFLLDSHDRKYSSTDKIRKSFGDNLDMFIVPAQKDNSQVTRGRGKGGLVTMWKKGLTKYVSKVSCTSFRIQATRFSFPAGSVLVINSYFPCDPRTDNFDETELLTLLADIRNATNKASCPNVFLAGDLNCHFNRNSRFTSIVRDFLVEELGLTIMWEHPDVDPGHMV